MKKIAIAGPGRSGTSFLVRLFEAWGYSVPDVDENWFETAQAGLESRIGGSSPFDVDKDPWAFNYIDDLSDEQLAQYGVMLVPIRDLRHAALSRSVQERFSRMSSGDLDHWSWDNWGAVPGGSIYETSVSGVESVLQRGLWRLLEVASRRGLPLAILNFPRIVSDFDYLWAQVGPFVSTRISEEKARAAWSAIAQADKVRIRDTPASMDADELQAIVRQQISHMDKLTRERDELLTERNVAVAERDAARADFEARPDLRAQNELLVARLTELESELNTMRASRNWRYTRPLRRTRQGLDAPGLAEGDERHQGREHGGERENHH